MKKIYLGCICSLIILAGVIRWVWTESGLPLEKPKAVKTAEVKKPEPALVTLAAVGDVVVHMPIVRAAFDEATGEYDFRPIFAGVRERLSRADLAVGVLETQINGADRQYTGYPRFNSPAAIADALKWAGIDLVFTAHNHSLDMGTGGIKRTLEYLQQIGLAYAGSRRSNQEKRYLLLTINGIKLAFLAYTTTTNGLKPPAGEEWAVNFFDYQKVTEDITELKQTGADCIILALHTGIEYQREPSPEQIKLIDWLVKSGVDIVLGSHVHVVQPLEYRRYVDPATGEARDYFIAYSLGNFLSNQRWRYSDYGLLVNLKLQKKPGRPGVEISQPSYAPLWVHRYLEQGKYQYRIKVVTGPEHLENDPGIDQPARERMKEVWEETRDLVRK